MTRMRRFYPFRWLAVALGLLGTQCLDSISDDCSKTLTCRDELPPVLDENCIWRYADTGEVWQGGPQYDEATNRWRWPDGTETATQTFNCSLDAGADAAALDCRPSSGAVCDPPQVCDMATGNCVECLKREDCSGNMPVGDAGAATICDLVSHECVQCVGDDDCSGDTPACKVDPNDSGRNVCVECTVNAQCDGANPVCDESSNECTARCTSPQECSGDKPVCNLTRQLCVECQDDTTCGNANATQCNTTTNQCVECTNDAPCRANGEVCDTSSNNCVQCREDLQCAGAATGSFCETETNLCVQCLNDQQCTSFNTSRCNTVTHQCVGCTSDSQCEEGRLCNTTRGVCVECLGDGDCTGALESICETSSGTCVECLSDAQCLGTDTARCVTSDPTPLAPLYTCAGCTNNSQCSGKTAGGLCRTADNVCVDCTENANCSVNAALSRCEDEGGVCAVCAIDADCDLIAGRNACKAGEGCVECVNDGHCAGNPDGAHCKVSNDADDNDQPDGDAPLNTCVECRSNADCTSPAASRCVNHECTACAADTDCGHLDTNGAAAGGTLGVCDAGTCVECTGPKREACGDDVCNSLAKTCATGVGVASADLCSSCVSDAHCAANARCVQQTVGTAPQFFCFPLQANGICSIGGFADRVTSSVPTIDGASALVCLQRETTCPAYLNYINGEDCDDEDDDETCGPEGRCESGPQGFACTISCVSSADCTGAAACLTEGCEL